MKKERLIDTLECLQNDMDVRQEDIEALKISIQSIEAWDEVLYEIKRYRADCELSSEGEPCAPCTKAVFDSIENIIKKHIKIDYRGNYAVVEAK